MTAPTASPDLVAKLVLNPLRNARSHALDVTTILNGVLTVYERLGDQAHANDMAESILEAAEIVQTLSVLIERISAQAEAEVE